MKKALIISIIINILFVLFGGYVVYKKGGIDYLKEKFKFNLKTDTANEEAYSESYMAKKSIFDIMPNDTGEIIFVGNSITEYCDWNELFGKSKR